MDKENKMKFEVRCNPHGLVGTVGQAVLGLELFKAHSKMQTDECLSVDIKPIKPIEVSWQQRKQMRRIVKNGK